MTLKLTSRLSTQQLRAMMHMPAGAQAQIYVTHPMGQQLINNPCHGAGLRRGSCAACRASQRASSACDSTMRPGLSPPRQPLPRSPGSNCLASPALTWCRSGPMSEALGRALPCEGPTECPASLPALFPASTAAACGRPCTKPIAWPGLAADPTASWALDAAAGEAAASALAWPSAPSGSRCSSSTSSRRTASRSTGPVSALRLPTPAGHMVTSEATALALHYGCRLQRPAKLVLTWCAWHIRGSLKVLEGLQSGCQTSAGDGCERGGWRHVLNFNPMPPLTSDGGL